MQGNCSRKICADRAYGIPIDNVQHRGRDGEQVHDNRTACYCIGLWSWPDEIVDFHDCHPRERGDSGEVSAIAKQLSWGGAGNPFGHAYAMTNGEINMMLIHA